MSQNSTASEASASDFLSTLAVNTKGSGASGGYVNASLIISSLDYIGVSTVRDSYVAYEQGNAVIDAMAAAGVKFDFVVKNGVATAGQSGIDTFIANLKAFTAAHPGSVIAVEGLNEANVEAFSYEGSSTLAAAAEFQKDLYTAIKAEPALSGVVVYNMTLANYDPATYAQLGDLGAYSDAANSHAYAGNGSNLDGRMESMFALAQGASSGDPLVVTETGYTTLSSTASVGASEAAQSILTLKSVLTAYENGSSQTYLYELFDEPYAENRGLSETQFGLFYADGTPKPAAVALHNFTTILSYGDSGAAFTGTDPAISLNGAPANTHSMVLTKSGETFDLVLWVDTKVWNETTKTDVAVAPTTMTVDLGGMQSSVRVYDPIKGLDPIAVYENVSSIQVPIGADPLIIEVGAASAVQESTVTTPASLTLTAAQFMAQIDTLAHSTTLTSVTLTDSHVLSVATPETMAYIIANYGDVLSKVSGGYSFTIPRTHETWRTDTTYDSNGVFVQRVTSGLVGGQFVKTMINYADGSYEHFTYAGNDPSHPSEHTVFNANGVQVLLERFNADGSYSYTQAQRSDGSVLSVGYDSTGHKISQQLIAADRTTTTTAYDAATGLMTQVRVVYPDGHSVTSTYSNGVMVKQAVLNTDGTVDDYTYSGGSSVATEHQRLDATGKLVLIERFRTDGTQISGEQYNADGSAIYTTYDAAGRLIAQQANASDGTKVYLTYSAASGQVTQQRTVFTDGHSEVLNYTSGVLTQKVVVNLDGTTDYYNYTNGTAITSHQKVDGAGTVLILERFNADGSLSYTEARNSDGSALFVTYDTSGRKLSQQANASDGTKVYLTYSAASGQVTQQRTVFTDGHSEVLNYTSGVLTQKVVVNTNGTTDYYNYFSGKTVVSSHQKLDASGNVVLLERFNADGSYSYSEARNPDGSSVFVTYDTSGRKLSQQTNQTDGTKVYLTYSATSGLVAQQRSVFADGHSEVLNYNSGGVLTQKVVVNTDTTIDYYSFFSGTAVVSSRQKVDSAGKVLLIERFRSDGTFSSSEAYNKDGSAVFVTYDTGGHKISQQTNQADGTKVYLTYSATSGLVTQQRSVFKDGHSEVLNYNTSGALTQKVVVNTDTTIDYYSFFSGTTVVSSRQKVDSSGKVLLIERFRSDGTFSSSEAYNKDGSAVFVTYDTGGHKISQQTNQADGTKVYLTYSATSGLVTQQRSVFKDGHSEVLNYNTSGVLTQKVVVNTDTTIDYYSYYSGTTVVSSRQKVDSAGKVLLIERFRSDGTFSSSEAYNKDGSAVFVTYDTGGHKISQQTNQADGTKVYITYSATTGVATQQRSVFTDGHTEVLNYNSTGVLTQKVVVAADGSSDYYTYANGSTVPTEHQKLTSSGAVVLIERFRTDGTYISSEATKPDGSFVYVTYDSAGRKIAQQTNLPDGTKVTITFDAASGVATQQQTVFTDGHSEVLTYTTAGVLTQKAVVNADKTIDYYSYASGSVVTSHQKVDPTGTVLLLEKFRSDGTYISSEAHNPDGSTVYVSYDSTGHKIGQQANAADGTVTNLTYDASSGLMTQMRVAYTDGHVVVNTYSSGVLTRETVSNPDGSVDYYSFTAGQSTATSHQKVDASGTVRLIERFNSDGSYSYSEARNSDGSTVIASFDTTGHKLTQTTYTSATTKVDTFLQDGSGDINHNTYAKNGALLSSDVEHGNGTHAVYYYTDGLALHGGAGDDAFYFGSTNTANAYYDGGHDLVYNFNASTDHILIASSFASDMSGLHISQTGSDVTINMDADHSIVLKNTQASSLTDGVFAFV